MPRIRSSAWLWIVGALAACGGGTSDLFESSSDGPVTGEGGDGASGPSNAGESAVGGDAGGTPTTGGRAQGAGGAAGGSGVGGNVGTGGSAAGGETNGGSVSGGVANGGADTGGMTGGGASSGGSNTGGISLGGKNTGGAGKGGAMACSDPDGTDYQTRGTAKGTNGSFEDECQGGDLVEYICETQLGTGPNCPIASADAAARPAGGGSGIIAPPVDCVVQTGKVIETTVDCGGRCRNGTCFYWCPKIGDDVDYLQVQRGEVVFENTRSGFRYSCEVSFERDDYNCSAFSLEGETANVYSTGNCNGTQVVFGTDTAEEPGIQTCTYTCTLVD